jgi:TubC N-terminal docking domain
MGAPDLLQHLRAAGFALSLADGDGIRVAPSAALTNAQRQAIRDHKPELLALLRVAGRNAPPATCTAALVKAINQCCAVRGDTEANRAALIAECAELDPREQADMTEHFNAEAKIWQRAARGGRP